MELKCKKAECTGCMACYNICPVNAIQMEREHGFFVPHIITEKCVNCGKCNEACPQIKPVEKFDPCNNIAYAVFNKDKKIRDTSSSGGVFYTMAEEIIAKNGTVYGAVWEKDFLVKVIRGTQMEDIRRMQGSKYVQSLTGDIFKAVRADLDEGMPVLYSGTGCQVAGLLKYLQKPYENLITCEVLCHGGASPIVFQEHVAHMEKGQQAKATSVNFRYKTNERCQNMKYEFQNGKTVTFRNPMEDLFYSGFQNGKLLREACYHCLYVGKQRCPDITLADFWGIDKEAVNYPDKMSYPSLVLLNTHRGEKFWGDIEENFVVNVRPFQEAVEGNLAFRRSIPKNIWRNRFFREYEENGYEKAAEHCLRDHFSIKEWIKGLIGVKATKILLKVLRR